MTLRKSLSILCLTLYAAHSTELSTLLKKAPASQELSLESSDVVEAPQSKALRPGEIEALEVAPEEEPPP